MNVPLFQDPSVSSCVKVYESKRPVVDIGRLFF
jgi:hypothetical protein